MLSFDFTNIIKLNYKKQKEKVSEIVHSFMHPLQVFDAPTLDF